MIGWNYPPGVTGNEPQIAGELHYSKCPLSEDYEREDEEQDQPQSPSCICDDIDEDLKTEQQERRRQLGW